MASDRSRGRKVGDATMERIDDLAGGWAVKQDRTDPIEKFEEIGEEPPPAARGTGDVPKAAEGSDVIRPAASSPPPPPGRKKRPTGPPPPPPGRKKRLTGPPPPPPGRKKSTSTAPPHRPELPLPPDRPPRPEPVAQPPIVAGFIDSADDRDDEETLHQPPVVSNQFSSEPGRKVGNNTTGTLRVLPSLPRRRGLIGDILYVHTAAFGVASSRRELAAVEKKLAVEKKERDRRLVELARHALADGELESTTLQGGRDEPDFLFSPIRVPGVG